MCLAFARFAPWIAAGSPTPRWVGAGFRGFGPRARRTNAGSPIGGCGVWLAEASAPFGRLLELSQKLRTFRPFYRPCVSNQSHYILSQAPQKYPGYVFFNLRMAQYIELTEISYHDQHRRPAPCVAWRAFAKPTDKRKRRNPQGIRLPRIRIIPWHAHGMGVDYQPPEAPPPPKPPPRPPPKPPPPPLQPPPPPLPQPPPV